MNQLKKIMLLSTLILSTQAYATMYENAEDESSSRWQVYDNTPAGAAIDNVYSSQRDNNAIEFIGAGTSNGYMLGNLEKRKGAWNNTKEHTLKWKMNFTKGVVVYIRVMTKEGARYLYYTNSNKSYGKRNNTYIHIGLGKKASDGTWHAFTRDLGADLKKYEPNNQLIAVNAFLVRGNGFVDDVELVSKTMNPNKIDTISAQNTEATLTLSMHGAFERGSHGSFFIDADNDSSTGYSADTVKGADYLVQGTALYQYNGDGNSWKWDKRSSSVHATQTLNTITSVIPLNMMDIVGDSIKYIASISLPNWQNRKNYREMVAHQMSGDTNPSLKRDTLAYYKKWKHNYLLSVDNTMSRIVDENSNRTVSEGQGYGMLIEALLPSGVDTDDQKIFNALWKFSRSRPSSICHHLMDWEYYPGIGKHDDSAFDGDADIAYALIKADEKWGSSGEVNYKNEAIKVLDDIWDCTIGEESKLPLLGDWVEQDGDTYNQYTARTSDFMLGHFKTFAQFTGDDKWLEVVRATQDALNEVQNETTGLVPDFIRKDNGGHYVAVEDGFLEEHDGDYYYNACRVPWRLGVDVMQSHDSVSRSILRKMKNWMKTESSHQAENIKAGYRLNGDVIGDYDTNAFIAPFGVAATALGDNTYAMKIRAYMKREEGYYEDTIALLSALAMEGIF